MKILLWFFGVVNAIAAFLTIRRALEDGAIDPVMAGVGATMLLAVLVIVLAGLPLLTKYRAAMAEKKEATEALAAEQKASTDALARAHVGRTEYRYLSWNAYEISGSRGDCRRIKEVTFTPLVPVGVLSDRLYSYDGEIKAFPTVRLLVEDPPHDSEWSMGEEVRHAVGELRESSAAGVDYVWTLLKPLPANQGKYRKIVTLQAERMFEPTEGGKQYIRTRVKAGEGYNLTLRIQKNYLEKIKDREAGVHCVVLNNSGEEHLPPRFNEEGENESRVMEWSLAPAMEDDTVFVSWECVA